MIGVSDEDGSGVGSGTGTVGGIISVFFFKLRNIAVLSIIFSPVLSTILALMTTFFLATGLTPTEENTFGLGFFFIKSRTLLFIYKFYIY